MKYSCIIWDFNGTIADDVTLSINAINGVLAKRGLPQIKNMQAYQEVFGFPVREYYARLGFNFHMEPYEIPAKEWVDAYAADMETITAVSGVKQVLEACRNAGMIQIILSACETNMLYNILGHLKLKHYFMKILTAEDIYGIGKISVAKTFAAETDMDLSTALLIGDTNHDAQTAKELGCDCVLYSGGHMAKEKLLCCGFPVMDQMSEVLHMIFS